MRKAFNWIIYIILTVLCFLFEILCRGIDGGPNTRDEL